MGEPELYLPQGRAMDIHSLQPFPPGAGPMASIDSFAPPPSLPFPTPTPTQHSTADSTDRARAYKSRNKRPCDFCRYKKAACHLENHPPCELCRRYNKECTFVESPAKRRRPNDDLDPRPTKVARAESYTSHEQNGSVGSQTPYTNTPFNPGLGIQHPELMGWDDSFASFDMPMNMGPALAVPDFQLDPAFYQPQGLGFDAFDPFPTAAPLPLADGRMSSLQHHSPVDTIQSPLSSVSHLTGHQSLTLDPNTGNPSSSELRSASNALLVGFGGVPDPDLVSRFLFDQHGECAFQAARLRKLTDGDQHSLPVILVVPDEVAARNAQSAEELNLVKGLRRDMEAMVGEDAGKRLIRLFHHHVLPYFPILVPETHSSMHPPSSIPTCLLATIYAHALAFYPRNDKISADSGPAPSPDALFKIAWDACLAEFQSPSLATLQALLLLLQRRPTDRHISHAPLMSVMMSAAISVMQSLGLHRDPSFWPLPPWEIRLRRRLAWSVFIQDKWLALNAGRSSQLRSEDWDVSPLTPEDYAEPGADPSSVPTALHSMKLGELSLIVEEVLHDLFSIRARHTLHNNLEATLEVAKPLRVRLTNWYQTLPPEMLPHQQQQQREQQRRRSQNPSPVPIAGSSSNPAPEGFGGGGHGSLHLAYLTLKIELFRAMLRPRATDGNATALTALRTGALAVAKENYEFLDKLDERELEGFWASYSRTNFTIVSSFMMFLFITSPSLPDAKDCLALATAWRTLLRTKGRKTDLLALALAKFDATWSVGVPRVMEMTPAAMQAWRESKEGRG